MPNSPSNQPKDFNLRPLPTQPLQPTPNPPAGPPAYSSAAPAAPFTFGTRMSSNDMVLAGGILLVLAIVFFFVRGGVRRHLIAGRASLSAASSAGWAVFAFLLLLSITVVLGLFGNLWSLLAFTVPMGGLVLVTLVLSIILYNAAASGRR